MAISHAGHNHPATPAARAACRKGIRPSDLGTPIPEVVRIDRTDYIADHIRKVAANGRMRARMDREYAEVKMTGDVARRMARQAAKADNARIQPRRSGARVSAAASTCVQAALHTRGRCACGWENWDLAS
jgi:hypothetical protein